MSQNSIAWFPTVKAITERLVSVPSISPNTEAENACARAIAESLTAGTGLQPELWPTGEGRHSVACLLKGEHPQARANTVILLCHYDTVGVEEYRPLDMARSGALAFDSAAVREALRAFLGNDPHHPVVRDLQMKWQDDWAWLAGRGSLDMKSGVAAHVAVLRQLWQERGALKGNVLFLATPDEETESAGVLSALRQLLNLRAAQKLNFLAVINSDYTAPRSDDDSERYLYTGAVGKLLPSFYVLGDPTHVGEPFRGVDAAQVAAELVRRVNLNVDLSDAWTRALGLEPEVAVPPMTLRLRDLKESYNVQTSAEAVVYVNWLTYSLSPAAALSKMLAVAQQALSAVLSERAAQFVRYKGQQPTPLNFAPTVLSFAELCRMAWAPLEKAGDGPEAQKAWLQQEAEAVRASTPEAERQDTRELSWRIVARLAQQVGLRRPAIVVFFAPPFYPHSQPHDNAATHALMNVLHRMKDTPHGPLAQKFQHAMRQFPNPSLTLRGFYPYIADHSYLQLDETVRGQIDSLVGNMPLFGRGYSLDFEAMAQLDCPVVNIGPWGKDAHGLAERVHMPYSFEVVPQLIYETVGEMLP